MADETAFNPSAESSDNELKEDQEVSVASTVPDSIKDGAVCEDGVGMKEVKTVSLVSTSENLVEEPSPDQLTELIDAKKDFDCDINEVRNQHELHRTVTNSDLEFDIVTNSLLLDLNDLTPEISFNEIAQNIARPSVEAAEFSAIFRESFESLSDKQPVDEEKKLFLIPESREDSPETSLLDLDVSVTTDYVPRKTRSSCGTILDDSIQYTIQSDKINPNDSIARSQGVIEESLTGETTILTQEGVFYHKQCFNGGSISEKNDEGSTNESGDSSEAANNMAKKCPTSSFISTDNTGNANTCVYRNDDIPKDTVISISSYGIEQSKTLFEKDAVECVTTLGSSGDKSDYANVLASREDSSFFSSYNTDSENVCVKTTKETSKDTAISILTKSAEESKASTKNDSEKFTTSSISPSEYTSNEAVQVRKNDEMPKDSAINVPNNCSDDTKTPENEAIKGTTISSSSVNNENVYDSKNDVFFKDSLITAATDNMEQSTASAESNPRQHSTCSSFSPDITISENVCKEDYKAKDTSRDSLINSKNDMGQSLISTAPNPGNYLSDNVGDERSCFSKDGKTAKHNLTTISISNTVQPVASTKTICIEESETNGIEIQAIVDQNIDSIHQKNSIATEDKTESNVATNATTDSVKLFEKNDFIVGWGAVGFESIEEVRKLESRNSRAEMQFDSETVLSQFSRLDIHGNEDNTVNLLETQVPSFLSSVTTPLANKKNKKIESLDSGHDSLSTKDSYLSPFKKVSDIVQKFEVKESRQPSGEASWDSRPQVKSDELKKYNEQRKSESELNESVLISHGEKTVRESRATTRLNELAKNDQQSESGSNKQRKPQRRSKSLPSSPAKGKRRSQSVVTTTCLDLAVATFGVVLKRTSRVLPDLHAYDANDQSSKDKVLDKVISSVNKPEEQVLEAAEGIKKKTSKKKKKSDAGLGEKKKKKKKSTDSKEQSSPSSSSSYEDSLQSTPSPQKNRQSPSRSVNSPNMYYQFPVSPMKKNTPENTMANMTADNDGNHKNKVQHGLTNGLVERIDSSKLPAAPASSDTTSLPSVKELNNTYARAVSLPDNTFRASLDPWVEVRKYGVDVKILRKNYCEVAARSYTPNQVRLNSPKEFVLSQSVKDLRQSWFDISRGAPPPSSTSIRQEVRTSISVASMRRSYGDLSKLEETTNDHWSPNAFRQKNLTTHGSQLDLSETYQKPVLRRSISTPRLAGFDSLRPSFNMSREVDYNKKIHVRSVDASKVQKQFNQASENQTPKSCKLCDRQVFQMEQIKAEKAVWHKNCFRCKECGKQLNVDTYESHEGILYCKPHYKQLFQPKAHFDDDEPKSSDKASLGLDELTNLDVKARFNVFERKTESQERELAKSPSQIQVKKAEAILNKVARFQSNGSLHHSESESEHENEDQSVLRSSKKRERPQSFAAMGDVKQKFSEGCFANESAQRREEFEKEKKEELIKLRARLCAVGEESEKEPQDQEVYRDPTVIRADDKIQDELPKDTTRKALSIFKQMEIEAAQQELASGPKPLKRFTPPPEYAGGDSESSEEESEYESEEEEEESDSDEVDEGVIKSSDKMEDEFLRVTNERAIAKNLRNKFERWEAEVEKENRLNHSQSHLSLYEEEGIEHSLESTRDIKARFEALNNQPTTPVIEQKSRTKVHRFVEIQPSITIDVCCACNRKVYAMERHEGSGRLYHKNCFKCSQCSCILRLDSFSFNAGKLYCIVHYTQNFKVKGNYEEGFGTEPTSKNWKTTKTEQLS